MTSDELNEFLSNFDDGFFGEAKHNVNGLEDTNKVIPYYGWYWRWFDFDGKDTLGCDGSFVGFMVSNKWGYASIWVEGKDMAALRAEAVKLATNPVTTKSLQAFFDYLQTFKQKFKEPYVADWAKQLPHSGSFADLIKGLDDV